MLESAIKAEVFPKVQVKKRAAEITPKPRTALLQEGENDVNIPTLAAASDAASESAINCPEPIKPAIPFGSISDNIEKNGTSALAPLYAADNSNIPNNARKNDVTIAAGILASENSCVDYKVAGSNPDIPVAGDDTMVMVNYLSNKGCESYHNESNNSSEIIIKPMVVLALEGENDIVSEATCNGSEIAKAALNKSSTQFMEHDVVVASTNNESFQEISRSGAVLFDGSNDATTVALVAT